MGMGFAYIVPDLIIAESIIKYLNKSGHRAKIVGAVERAQKSQKELTTTLWDSGNRDFVKFVGYSAQNQKLTFGTALASTGISR